LGQLLSTIERVRGNANPRLEIIGLLPNKVNARSKNQAATLAQVKQFAGDLLLPHTIYERAPISDMLAMNRPVWEGISGESHRKGAMEMYGVCKAIIKRIFK
jgi:chromosome partitioning protein